LWDKDAVQRMQVSKLVETSPACTEMLGVAMALAVIIETIPHVIEGTSFLFPGCLPQQKQNLHLWRSSGPAPAYMKAEAHMVKWYARHGQSNM
jgi:hypothetical protein